MEHPVEGTALLPDDLLADILSRLAPRELAMALGVCRAWRAVIDGRRLLRADLLPLSLGGIFVNFYDQSFSEYFFPTSTNPTISSMADYVPYSDKRYDRRYVVSHCNGLLLLYGGYVVNPATRWWAQIPRSSHMGTEYTMAYGNYLVFDPILSSDYEVFSIQQYYRDGAVEDHESERPLSSCILHVFSSKTRGWEDRLFIRNGEAVAAIPNWERNSAVYYKRALYVHCETDIVLRISLLARKYRAIKPPYAIRDVFEGFDLGKSKDGVCFASLYPQNTAYNRLQFWVLSESCGQTEWLLKYRGEFPWQVHENLESWVLQDVNYNYQYGHLSNVNNEPERDDKAKLNYFGSVRILGFHPFKEVVFLCRGLRWGLAYDLTSSKLQYLGYLYPTEYNNFSQGEDIIQAYPYTPCWI